MNGSVFDKKPWDWSEEEIRSSILTVRAGRPLRPSSWPGGKRCAVGLSFDVDHESNELRDGGRSVSRLSWGEYGARVGIPRLTAILKRHDVPATFFIPAVVAGLYPDHPKMLVDHGHEVGIHGWIHEVASQLPEGVERDLLTRSVDRITEISGVRPVGARMPSMDLSRETLGILRDLGIEYDSSLMADEDCYEIEIDGKPSGLVELPIDWSRDDGAYLWMERFGGVRPYTSPEDVFRIFVRELDAAHEEGGIFQVVLHPHVIGYRSRAWIVEALIEHAKGKGDVWFATHADIVRWSRDHAEGGKGARPHGGNATHGRDRHTLERGVAAPPNHLTPGEK